MSKAFTDFKVKSEINISDSSNLNKLSPDRPPTATISGVDYTRRGSQEICQAIENCLERAARLLPSLSAIAPASISNLSDRTIKVIDSLVNEISTKQAGLTNEFSESKTKLEALEANVDTLESALLRTSEIGIDALEFI